MVDFRKALLNQKKEQENMPKSRPDDPFNDDDWGQPEGASSEASTEVPESTVDPNRLPWIKPSNVLPLRQGRMELVSFSGPSKYSDVTLVVKFGGKQYHLGLQTFDPSFVALRKRFGAKKEDWHGTLLYKVMPHKGNPNGFIAVRPA